MGLSIYNQNGTRSDMNITRPLQTTLATGWYDSSSNQDAYILTDAPTPMSFGTAAWDENTQKFYIPGPYNGSSYLTTMYIFDPVSGIWTSLSINNGMRGGKGSFVLGDNVFYGPDQSSDGDVFRKNLITNDNVVAIGNPSAQTRPHRLGAMSYNSDDQLLYLIGDSDTTHDRWLDIMDMSDPLNITFFNSFEMPVFTTDTRLYPASNLYLNGKVYIYENGTGHLIEFDTTSQTFLDLTICPVVFSGDVRLFGYNGNVILYGYSSNTTYVYRYNVSSDTWELLSDSPPTSVNTAIPTIRDNELWFFGGSNTSSTTLPIIQIYSI